MRHCIAPVHGHVFLKMRCFSMLSQLLAWLMHDCGLQAQELQCPIRIVSLSDKHHTISKTTGVGQQQSVDMLLDVNNCWPGLSGVFNNGAVLVRPDGHVLWHCRDAADLGFDADKSSSACNHDSRGVAPADNTVSESALQHIKVGLKDAMQICLGKKMVC